MNLIITIEVTLNEFNPVTKNVYVSPSIPPILPMVL